MSSLALSRMLAPGRPDTEKIVRPGGVFFRQRATIRAMNSAAGTNYGTCWMPTRLLKQPASVGAFLPWSAPVCRPRDTDVGCPCAVMQLLRQACKAHTAAIE